MANTEDSLDIYADCFGWFGTAILLSSVFICTDHRKIYKEIDMPTKYFASVPPEAPGNGVCWL